MSFLFLTVSSKISKVSKLVTITTILDKIVAKVFTPYSKVNPAPRDNVEVCLRLPFPGPNNNNPNIEERYDSVWLL